MLATDADRAEPEPEPEPGGRRGRRSRRAATGAPLELRADVIVRDRAATRADADRVTPWWTIGRLLLAVALVALPLALFFAIRPVTNPGVQDCGSPAAFFLTGREERIVLPPLPGEEVSEDVRRQSAQPPCRERAAEQMRNAGRAGAVFFVAAFLGAVFGLVDERLAYRRAPRFETLLRDLPPAQRARHGLVAQVRVDELGVRLPPVERPEAIGLVFWALVALVGLPVLGGGGAVFDVLRSVSVGGVLLAVVFVVLRAVAAAAQRWPVRPALTDAATTARWTVASAWVARVRPIMGAFGVDVHALRRNGVTRGEAVRRVRALQSTSLVVHLALLAVGLLATVGFDRPAFDPGVRILVLAFVLVLLAANGLAHAPRRIRGLPVRPSRTALQLDRVAAEPRDRAVLVAGAIGVPLAEALAFAALLGAVGAPLPLGVVLFVVIAAVTLSVLGPVSGGAPTMQAGAMLLLVVVAGADAPRAAAAALLFGALVHWLPMIPGLIATKRLRAADRL